MNSESKLLQLWQDLRDKIAQALQESPLIQQVKSKYDELDTQTRLIVNASVAGGAALLVCALLLNSVLSVRALKRDLDDRNDLIRLLQSANDDLRKLKEEASASGISTQTEGAAPPAWSAHFEAIAGTSGIPKESLAIGSEKPGKQGERTREALFDITLTKINVRQLARFANSLETGNKPVKIRNMKVQAKPDGSAWLDATLYVSAFQLKAE